MATVWIVHHASNCQKDLGHRDARRGGRGREERDRPDRKPQPVITLAASIAN